MAWADCVCASQRRPGWSAGVTGTLWSVLTPGTSSSLVLGFRFRRDV